MAENERFPVKLFPTATATDVLFYVTVGRLDKRKIPEYGTKYNDITPRVEDWPHHRLVYVSSPDNDGKQKWFFAADREKEDDYNWTLGQGEELIRSYLVRRDFYLQRSVVEAAADPKQEGEFTYPVAATLDSAFIKYGFADDTVLEAPDELKSIYVVVKRRFLRPEVSEIIYDEKLDLRIKRSFLIVPPDYTLDANTVGVTYELEPVNTFHSRRVKREVLPKTTGWTLASYLRTQAVRTSIPNLPRELLSVNVVWNASYSVGTQDYMFAAWETGTSFTIGKQASDSADSAASVTPEIQLRFRDIESSNLPAVEYELMIPGDVTEAAVIARLNAILSPTTVQTWPVFRPESVTINTSGQSIKVGSNVGISLSGSVNNGSLVGQSMDRSVSDDFSITLSVGAVQIPACLHGAIAITGDTSRSQLVAATATMTMFNSFVGTNSATKTKTGVANGSVSPTSLPAVSGPQTIPTSGLYVLDIRPGGNFMGCTFVTVTVLNAIALA